MFRLRGRLKHIKRKLKQCNHEVFGNIGQEKKFSKRKWTGSKNYVFKKDTMRSGKRKRTNCNRNGRKDASKRKYYGDRNLEFSG
jgi:hypothetical protein